MIPPPPLCASTTAPIPSTVHADGSGSPANKQQQHAAMAMAAPHMLSSGLVLIGHPLLPHWFSRTLVLLCAHSPLSGAYGLCMNKPWGGSVLDLVAEGRAAGAEALTLGFLSNGVDIGVDGATASSSSSSASLGEEGTTPLGSGVYDTENSSSDEEEGEDDDDELEQTQTQKQKQMRNRVVEAIRLLTANSSIHKGEEGEGETMEGVQVVLTADDEELVELLATAAEALGPEWDGKIPKEVWDMSAKAIESAIEGAEGLEEGQKRELLEALHALSTSPAPLSFNFTQSMRGSTTSSSSSTTTFGSDRTSPASSSDDDDDDDKEEEEEEEDASLPPPIKSVTAREFMAVTPHSHVFLGGPIPGVGVLHQHLSQLQGREVGRPVEVALAPLHLQEGIGVSLPEAARIMGEDSPLARPHQIRFYLGSARWVPGQLEGEIERGSWAVVDVRDVIAAQQQQGQEGDGEGEGEGGEFDVFNTFASSATGTSAANDDKDGDTTSTMQRVQYDTWKKVLEGLGPEYGLLASVPPQAWDDVKDIDV